MMSQGENKRKWRSCCVWYCFFVSLSGALLLAYITALCGLEVEYLKVDDKPRSTWVAGAGSGVYLVCFIGSGVYIYIERRREGMQAREKIESYSLLLPIERVDEEI
jgi:hypothetical protein